MKKTIAIIWLFYVAALHAVDVSASLSAHSVPAGEGIRLTLKIEGGTPSQQPVFPKVENLMINPRGTSQQTQIINGKVTRALTLNYIVGSNQPGDYEIPAITVYVNGKEYTTKPLSLKIGANANKVPQGMANENSPEEPGKYGHISFQTLKNERKHVYPGEIAPVKISAYFPADARVSLTSVPRPEGSAFTLHNLSQQPNQSFEIINGQRYLVVTWFGGLSATKAGKYPASFVLTGTVAIRDDSATSRRSAFRGSLLDQFFAPMVQKDIELTTADAPQLEVKELPLEGRPENFTGAIGQFEFESTQFPEAIRTGEPFQIETTVRGTGNFSLLSAPKPLPQDEWKTYDGDESFAPEDIASFGGKKTFRYHVVPLTPGEKEVGMSFSYFEPEKGEYREVKSASRKISITGEAVKPNKIAEATEPEKPQPEIPEIAPLATELGATESYAPLSEAGWFVPVLASCGFLSLAIIGIGAWKGRASDPAKEAKLANALATRNALEAAKQAAEDGNELAFFTAAKTAIRLGIAQRDSLRPEAITLADLNHQEDTTITEILETSDHADYSGEKISVENLKAWNGRLEAYFQCLAAKQKKLAV